MSNSQTCPQCGAVVPASAPAGLCPACLLQAGFASQSGVNPSIPPTHITPPTASAFVPPTPEELARLFPQLEVLELLGKGGMGAVYKARHPGLDRLVAIKILPSEISHDPAFAERFQREARALARLSHPNIVAVYDFGQAEGLYYFVMEFVDGANLRQMIRAGNLASLEALAIVPQICDALQFAHDEGIVHRDIKPENILIDKKGRVKIADFGLAKLLGEPELNHALTGTHQVMGTLRYMAPEQMQGSRQVDHRADIYSLGVVFYELLTGELPMGKFAPPSKRVQIDVRLDDVVLRALEQHPEQRYQHASEIKSDVETVSKSNVSPVKNQPTRASHATAEVSDKANGQPVKGPGIALMLYGLVLALPAVWCFIMGMDIFDGDDRLPVEAGGVLIVFSFIVMGLAGLVMRGGWHMLTLESYRAAVLAGFLGQPIGIWALFVLSRPEVRAAFAVGRRAPSQTSTRPRMVPILAAMNVLGGILLMLFSSMEDPQLTSPSVPLIWRIWGQVDAVLGFIMAAGLFAASIGLFLWQPWARKLIIGVCIFGLASVVLDAPYLARSVIPDFYTEIQKDIVAEGVSPDVQDFVTLLTFLVLFGGTLLVGLTWLIGQLVYFTRPRLIAAFAETSAQSAPAGTTSPKSHSSPPLAEVTSSPLNVIIEPRLSRFALWGAIWAGVGTMGLLLMTLLMVPTQVSHSGGIVESTSHDGIQEQSASAPRDSAGRVEDLSDGAPPEHLLMLAIALMTVAVALAASSVVGTTIFGAVAIGHIKHSGGRLYGLRLAFADAIYYPMLVLAVVTGTLTHFTLITIWTHWPWSTAALQSPDAAPQRAFPGEVFMIVDAIAAIVVCFLVGRAVWRAVVSMPSSSPLASDSASSQPGQRSDGWGNAGWIAGGVSVVLLIGLGIGLVLISADGGASLGTPRRASIGYGSAPIPPVLPLEMWKFGPEGPNITDEFARLKLNLQSNQISAVNSALREAYREFLMLESQNLEQTTDDAGHLVTTIKPFANPLAKVEDRLWTQIDAVLSTEQQSIARLNMPLHPKPIQAPIAVSEIVAPGFFGWGKDGARVEVWKVGSWFHWRIDTRGYVDSAQNAEGLPPQLQRFWKEPAEKPETVAVAPHRPLPENNATAAPPPAKPDLVRLERIGHLADGGDDPFLSLAVEGQYAYMIQGNVEKPKRLQVVDLTDPSQPKVVGSSPVTVEAMRVAVSGKYAYVLDEPKLRVFDVSDPAAPRDVGSCELGQNLWDLVVVGKNAYVTDVESVRVIDLENPSAPKQVGQCEVPSAQGIAVSGQYAYIACDIEGLHVVDVSDPLMPREVGRFRRPAGAAAVAIAGKYAYIAGGEDAVTLWVADISDPTRPRRVGNFGDWIAGSVAVQGNLTFLAGGDLDILDTSNPAEPKQVGSHSDVGFVMVAADQVYVIGDEGFSVMKVVHRDKDSPQTP